MPNTPYSTRGGMYEHVHAFDEMKFKYDKLLEFAKHAAKNSCCLVCSCLACDALTVLRQIGEDPRCPKL